MLVKYQRFGSVVANLSFVENKDIETVCTDGETVEYNPFFLEQLTSKEQVFILAHEVSHVVFKHIERCENRDLEVWNLATDAVINANLQQDGLTMPKIGGVDIPDAINYDAEQIYDKLLEMKNKLKELQDKLGNIPDDLKEKICGGSCPFDQKMHASHDSWGSNKKNSSLNKRNNGKNSEDKTFDEKEIFVQIRTDRKKQLEELKNNLIKNSTSSGSEPGNSYRNMGEIGTGKPLIDWRILLKSSTNQKIDWSYKNAIIENGVLTPRLEEEMMPSTEIVLDTSGSISETLLRNFLRECKNILQTSSIRVGCFDTKFYGFHLIKNLSDIDNMKFEGGGGTSFEVAVSSFSKRVDNKIIFTDGYAYMPSKKVDAIWVVFGNRKINPIGGKVIYISEEQLARLTKNPKTKIKKYNYYKKSRGVLNESKKFKS